MSEARRLTKDEQQAIDRLGHGEPERCACIAHVLARRLAESRAREGELETALERLLVTYEVTLDLVTEAITRAEATKKDYTTATDEQCRQQGIADIARQVRIYLEDNEGLQPVAQARAALAQGEKA